MAYFIVNYIFDVNNHYGFNKDGPLPELQTNNNIPDINTIINETTLNFIQQMNPIEDYGNHGMNMFSHDNVAMCTAACQKYISQL